MIKSVTVRRTSGWPDTMTSEKGREVFIPSECTFEYTLCKGSSGALSWGISAVRITGPKIVEGVTTRNTFGIDWSSYSVGRVPSWIIAVGRLHAPK